MITLPVQEIDTLWFGGLEFQPGKPGPPECIARWFRATEEFDDKCKPYENIIREIAAQPLPSLLELASTPEKSLTLILLLDQLSRNILRGPSCAFVYKHCDPLAIQIAYHCIEKGHDKAHPPYKQFWYYLPLAHSESVEDQEMALSQNAGQAWDIRRSEWKEFHSFCKTALDYSINFYRTIEQFGRFPSRNAILGRETTPDEQKFLDSGAWNPNP